MMVRRNQGAAPDWRDELVLDRLRSSKGGYWGSRTGWERREAAAHGLIRPTTTDSAFRPMASEMDTVLLIAAAVVIAAIAVFIAIAIAIRRATRVPLAASGRRLDGRGEDDGGAAVAAPLKPKPPVLASAAAKELPGDDAETAARARVLVDG